MFQRIDFSVAYSFADAVVQAVAGSEAEDAGWYLPDPDDPLFLDRIRRPHRDTLLHHFVRALNYEQFEPVLDNLPDALDDATALLVGAGIPVPRWLTWKHVSTHTSELDSLSRAAISRITIATFQVLFSDLPFLHRFQHLVASRVSQLSYAEHDKTLRSDGIVRRGTAPAWLRPAIFHRDKGICQHCRGDVSGILRMKPAYQLDHVLPLAAGGTNDPTNWQLLCGNCNLEKGKTAVEGKWLTELYWVIPDKW
jgi:hypothetical protein